MICTHCRYYLPNGSAIHECTFCRVALCTSCISEHHISHKDALVTVLLRQLSADAAQIPKTCNLCQSSSIHHYDCQSCSYALCEGCWAKQGVNKHAHKQFILHQKMTATNLQLYCCKEATLAHCARCTKGFLKENTEEMHLCRQCYFTSGTLQLYCNDCKYLPNGYHNQSHQLVEWAFRESFHVDEVVCATCEESFDSVLKTFNHSHESFIQLASAWQLERAVTRTYKACRRKKCRTDEIIPSGSFTCYQCDHSYNGPTMACNQCSDTTVFCKHCYENNPLHHHPRTGYLIAYGDQDKPKLSTPPAATPPGSSHPPIRSHSSSSSTTSTIQTSGPPTPNDIEFANLSMNEKLGIATKPIQPGFSAPGIRVVPPTIHSPTPQRPGAVSAQSNSPGAPLQGAASTSIPLPPRPRSALPPTEFMVAKCGFVGSNPGDLSFQQGDLIQVIRKTPNQHDWWLGMLNGKKGIFPANYCEPQKISNTPLPPRPGDSQSLQPPEQRTAGQASADDKKSWRRSIGSGIGKVASSKLVRVGASIALTAHGVPCAGLIVNTAANQVQKLATGAAVGATIGAATVGTVAAGMALSALVDDDGSSMLDTDGMPDTGDMGDIGQWGDVDDGNLVNLDGGGIDTNFDSQPGATFDGGYADLDTTPQDYSTNYNPSTYGMDNSGASQATPGWQANLTPQVQQQCQTTANMTNQMWNQVTKPQSAPLFAANPSALFVGAKP